MAAPPSHRSLAKAGLALYICPVGPIPPVQKYISPLIRRLSLLPLLALLLTSTTPALAQSMTTAGVIFNAYSNAFYKSNSGSHGAYFQITQTGGGYTTFWEETEEMECVIDAYEWTTNASYKAIITNLLNGFTYEHGTNWPSTDDYNDDCLWSVMDFARGGMDTGITNYCGIARFNFTNVFARAWSTNDGGGLWWKYPDNDQKNACVNGPGAIAAYLMYQIYGDTNFWNDSSNIYFWERSHLYSAGKVYDHLSITNNVVTLNTVPTTYNQGTFIGAANFLGQISDATAAANYTKNSMGSGGILPQYGIENNNSGFNAIFYRWMMRFIRDNNLQSTWQAWLQTNANAAWNLRRTSDNLSWCQWLQQTPATNLYSWDCIASLEAIDAMPQAMWSVTNVGGDSLRFNWALGTLQTATNVAGPYLDITNVSSPYTVPMTNQQQFFRLKEN